MSWFRRSPPAEEIDDPQPPLDIYELEPAPTRLHVDFGEKPTDLISAAATREWTRPPVPTGFVDVTAQDDPQPLTVAWQATPPTTAGAWWTMEPGASRVRLCIVLDVGGRLCIRERSGDSCTYRSVAQFKQQFWAGPIATPALMLLEELSP